MSLDRLAYGGLLLVALTLGLGDIARVNPLDILLLTSVRGLLLVTIGLALAARLVQRRLPAFPTALALPVAAWLGVLVVSAALAPAERSAALTALERPAAGALLAWAVYELCRDRQRWLQLARALALGGLAIAVVGLAEASGAPTVRSWLAALHDGPIPIGDVPRIASTLSHPNEASILIELSLPLLIGWTWTAKPPWRTLLALGTLGGLVAMVLTFSRAGILAGLAALGLMAGMCVARGDRRQLVPLGAVALAVPAALIWTAWSDPGLDHRLTAGIAESNDLQPSRLEFWSVAWLMLRDHPLLGVGPDNFRWLFSGYSGVPADNLGIHAHNQYLEALADTGILGLLSFGWLLTRLVRTAAEGTRSALTSADWPWRAALLASLIAWLLHALLDDFERFWPASVAFWLIAGLAVRLQFAPDRQRLKTQNTRPTIAITTSNTRMPAGLASAAPPPPPPPKLTIR